MKTYIIGIHGLAGKPPKTTLEKWWRLSILEGLRRNIGRRPFFDFQLVYRADYINPKPADPNEKDPGQYQFFFLKYSIVPTIIPVIITQIPVNAAGESSKGKATFIPYIPLSQVRTPRTTV